MRKRLRLLSLIFLAGVYSASLWSQCTPGDATTCPDPENNGQVCPDSLQAALAGRFFSHAFTILPPPEYGINETDTIQLHHITLVDVTNLPPGFTWQSNSETNEFMIGTYYCVLLEGTPGVAGKYPLHITVDVYVRPFPTLPPILAATVTDSTSLFLEVKWDPNGIAEPPEKPWVLFAPRPNPFSDKTQIGVQASEPGAVTLCVVDLVGQTLHQELLQVKRGDNYFTFDGHSLTRGIYILKVSNRDFSQSVRLIKTE